MNENTILSTCTILPHVNMVDGRVCDAGLLGRYNTRPGPNHGWASRIRAHADRHTHAHSFARFVVPSALTPRHKASKGIVYPREGKKVQQRRAKKTSQSVRQTIRRSFVFVCVFRVMAVFLA